jgi:hypothetical protein
MRPNHVLRGAGVLLVLLAMAGESAGQSLLRSSVNSGAGRLTSTNNTLVMNVPYYSGGLSSSSSNSLLPGILVGCSKPPKPTITVSGADTESPTLTSSATSNNQWYLNGTAIAGATGSTLAITGEGIYTVRVGTGTCLSDPSDQTALVITGDIASSSRTIVAYPNPAESFIEVSGLQGDNPDAVMVDMIGRTSRLTLRRSGEAHRGELGDLSAGVYLLRVKDGESMYQVRILKK